MENVLELLRVFVGQGHSGFSAPYCIDLFKKLANWEVLTPLTGEDDEWINQTALEPGCYQNKRCSHVFKDKSGTYDIQGKVFIRPDGSAYTSKDSHVSVTFPYTPKTEYINVEE